MKNYFWWYHKTLREFAKITHLNTSHSWLLQVKFQKIPRGEAPASYFLSIILGVKRHTCMSWHGKVFLGCHTSRREFAWSTYEEKVILCCFLTQKSPLNHLTWRRNIQTVRKWRLWSKFLRENVLDVLFLDVFNQANFKYTPKKDFHITNF